MAKQWIPIISTNKLDELREFYTRMFGFSVVYQGPAYLGLKHQELGTELGFMPPDGPTCTPFNGQGVCLGWEVEDVDAEYARLVELGAKAQSEPADMPWGDRMFTLNDPCGLMLYLFKSGKPNEEHAQYMR